MNEFLNDFECPHHGIPARAIRLAVAKQGISNYGRYCEMVGHGPNHTHAFTISADDLDAALHDMESGEDVSLRAYLAWNAGVLHLYFVPVKDGKDIIPECNGEPFVYDLVLPCPNTCDHASVLNIAYERGYNGTE